MKILLPILGWLLAGVLAFLIGSMLTGCAATDNPHIFDPRGFAPDELQTLQAAADEWSIAGYSVKVDTCSPDDHCSSVTALRADHGTDGSINWVGKCLAYNEFGISNTCEKWPDAAQFKIVLAVTEDLSDIYKDFLHELGHTKGLPDSSDCGKTMSQYYHCEPTTLTQ